MMPNDPVSVEPRSAEGGAGSAGALPPEYAEAARALFGDRLDLAVAYAEALATDGVARGLIGPREASRIWERHLLNCAVVAELIPASATVIDVGTGAGLPGVVLALARPDLSVTLVESMARRTAFLTEVVGRLGLDGSVMVVRGRAEERTGPVGAIPPADVVTARAVAPLGRLAAWCLPLAAVGGRLLAIKGESAADEVAAHRAEIARAGGDEPLIRTCGVGLIDPPTTVVEIVKARAVSEGKPKSTNRRRRRSR
jgi:16S rRNA (guanine527-N7)-methyltransferase